MRAPDFWWQPEAGAAAIALWPASRIWGAAAAWRMGRGADFRPPVPVLCVGNLVVGGAGKTPTAIAMVRAVRGRGLRPGILASGYGGAARAPVLVDPSRHRAAEVGDEALVLAAAAPTVIAARRPAGARRLLDEGVNFLILDDGFQDPSVAKDVTIVAVDAGAGVGNGRVIPAGPLRAPLNGQLRRSDTLLIIGEGDRAEPLIRTAARSGRPVMRAKLAPNSVRAWRKGRALAYAGIGRPQKFFDTLAAINVDLAHARAFPDHHRFTAAEAAQLLDTSKAEGLRLITTEKDYARLAGENGVLAQLRERSEPFPVTLKFDNPTAVGELIDEAIRRAAEGAGRG